MKMKFLAVLFLVSPILVAQEITVFPSFWGESFYKDKEKITWKEFGMLMDATPEAQEYWQKSKKQMLGGLIAGAANLGSGIWYLTSEDKDKDTTGPIIAFAGTAIIGSIFYWSANTNKRKAILEYNEALGKKMSYQLVPLSSENGVGLALKF